MHKLRVWSHRATLYVKTNFMGSHFNREYRFMVNNRIILVDLGRIICSQRLHYMHSWQEC